MIKRLECSKWHMVYVLASTYISLAESVVLLVQRVWFYNHFLKFMCWVTVDTIVLYKHHIVLAAICHTGKVLSNTHMSCTIIKNIHTGIEQQVKHT